MINGANTMQILVIVGIIIAAATAIPLSVKYLGANNPVEQVAEEVIKEELPTAEAELPAAAAAVEAVANPPAAQ